MIDTGGSKLLLYARRAVESARLARDDLSPIRPRGESSMWAHLFLTGARTVFSPCGLPIICYASRGFFLFRLLVIWAFSFGLDENILFRTSERTRGQRELGNVGWD